MKSIPLGKPGLFALVDDADFAALSRHPWHSHTGGYVARNDGGRTVYLHRAVLKAARGVEVDHIDGDKLNNTRANLRTCTRSQNEAAKPKCAGRPTTSQFKGVSYVAHRNRWRVTTYHNGRRIELGYFDDEIRAAQAYDVSVLAYYGEFARLNFPGSGAGVNRI